MIKGHGYRFAQPYTASLNWVGDSRLANQWHAQISFEHIFRSTVIGVFKTSPRSIDMKLLRFGWEFVAFSDVGERYHAFINIQLRGHGPDSDIGIALVDSGGNQALWVMDGAKVEVAWSIGNILRGPWTFRGDPTIWTSPVMVTQISPVKYFEE